MNYFPKRNLIRRIVLDPQAINSQHPEHKKKLNRIAQNYERLQNLFDDLEHRFELDDRLANSVVQPDQSGNEILAGPRKRVHRGKPLRPGKAHNSVRQATRRKPR
jgi:hypothetical protein